MLGEKPKLTSLAARKQLLVLESDLNRAHFIESVHDLKDECQRIKLHFTHLNTMVAKVAATVSTARQIFSRRPAGDKKSWMSFLLDGVTAGTSLWYTLRARKQKEEEE